MGEQEALPCPPEVAELHRIHAGIGVDARVLRTLRDLAFGDVTRDVLAFECVEEVHRAERELERLAMGNECGAQHVAGRADAPGVTEQPRQRQRARRVCRVGGQELAQQRRCRVAAAGIALEARQCERDVPVVRESLVSRGHHRARRARGPAQHELPRTREPIARRLRTKCCNQRGLHLGFASGSGIGREARGESVDVRFRCHAHRGSGTMRGLSRAVRSGSSNVP